MKFSFIFCGLDEWNDTREARKKAIYNILNKCNKKKKVVDVFFWGGGGVLVQKWIPVRANVQVNSVLKTFFFTLSKNVVNECYFCLFMFSLYNINKNENFKKLTTLTRGVHF